MNLISQYLSVKTNVPFDEYSSAESFSNLMYEMANNMVQIF